MKRTNKRPIGNGFLAMIVLVIFITGIATMLISGHRLNLNSNKDNDSTSSGTDVNQTSNSSSSTTNSSLQPNAFEEQNSLPDDYKLISVLNDDVYKGALILVNYQYEAKLDGENLVNIYENGSSSYSVKNDDMYINSAVMEHLNDFLDDFESAEGSTSILISSSYRSKQDQQEIYDESVATNGEASTAYYVAVPGYSEHQTGYCFDTATYNYNDEMVELDGEGVYGWLIDNCADYGFVLRYPDDKTNITSIGYEAWHFRYVGVPHAYFMNDHNLCLEEYIAGIQKYTFENGGLLIDKGDKGKWITYYVPKLEAFNTTEIPVPKNCDYTISGDNIGGFIVTVDVTQDSANSLLETATDNWSFDNTSLIIEDFKDYVPGEDDDISSSNNESDGIGDNRTSDWESDSFWDDEDEDSTEDESQFDYVDYYDGYYDEDGEYYDNYDEDYGYDGYYDENYDYYD